jgi:hypothetical protein
VSDKAYPYEYFSGANIVVSFGQEIIDEAVGISYNVMDSKQPIYGYSSVMFDAVAPGQILVQGSLAINFRTTNYLFSKITRDKYRANDITLQSIQDGAAAASNANDLPALKDPEKVKTRLHEALKKGNQEEIMALMQRLRMLYTSQDVIEQADFTTISKSPLSAGPVNITITYGDKPNTGRPGDGVHTINIISAFFVGRASTIQIDETVIIEEYPFFARAMSTDMVSALS